MKKLILSVLISLFLIACSQESNKELSIIPQPKKIEQQSGEFTITEATKIIYTPKFDNIDYVINYLNNYLKTSSGISLKVSSKKIEDNFINLKYDKEIKNSESYKLSSDKNGITISASNSQGLFYGVQTLFQLLPSQIYSQKREDFSLTIPLVKIEDEPRFVWRGVHLDVGRHFFNVDSVKKYIDYLAMHKMNKFHWHLTEDQGWRIEIKKYPRLTTVGSKRKETMGNGKPYGGFFYTQEEVKEIVKYARERFITVIPEIEMPGHSLAALAAYPELSCTGGKFKVGTTWGVFDDVYCAGNEKVFSFLEDVLNEVIELFPSKYIHIGGDECPKTRWKKCKKCQQRIKKEGLKDEHELQSYFIERIEKFLLTKGRNIIGWDEILEGGLAPKATVMSWRGVQGGIDAAKAHHDVIMTPGEYCYFDHYQGDPLNEPHTFGGRLTLTKVYSYEPIPEELNTDEAKYILGAQANLWTERVPTFKDLEYQLLPRLSAISEVVWATKENKDLKKFLHKLDTQLNRYDYLKAHYSTSSCNVNITGSYNNSTKTLEIKMDTEIPDIDIFYTLDGSTPTDKSTKYTAPIVIKKSSKLKAVGYKNGKLVSRITEKDISVHKAFGKPIEIKHPYAKRYASIGEHALLDGQFGTNSFKDSYWQGYEGEDFEVVVDLEKETEINSVEIGFIQDISSWIFLPKYVEFSFSENGKSFTKPSKMENEIDEKFPAAIIQRFTKILTNGKYRYIKIFAKNIGICPNWHYGARGKAWLFADEICVK